MKTSSAFYSPSQLQKVRDNIRDHNWAKAAQTRAILAAQPWRERSDDELWHLMFSHTIPRSWMVWSNGHCPACRQDVLMYNWKIDAVAEPWKLRCPHCEEQFPTNDFAAFHRSGLNQHNLFDATLADRSLLFNLKHPDPADPLHSFGVDDGNGYHDGAHCWRFIAAYLVYGHWKQLIVAGIQKLAAAYALTGDSVYARKAGILIDRVADLYPDFDFFTQGFMYDQQADTMGSVGYVSYWADCCEETREIVIAYDMVFDALRNDAELVAFLSGKAAEYKLPNAKASWCDIQTNIEERILREAIINRAKIKSNYPRTDMAVTLATTVLGWPENRAEVEAMIDGFVAQSVAVDGVTGEKGLSNYSAFATQGLAMFLGTFSRLDPQWLGDLVKRHPQLARTYRFFIDTWCIGSYYPAIGDSSWFAGVVNEYRGVNFRKPNEAVATNLSQWGLTPSMFTLLWDLYHITGDTALVQVLYGANDISTEALPHDLFAADPAALQREVQAIIEQVGSELQPGSIDLSEWHLAILRGGSGEHKRAVWLDYDTGGAHAHADGMNLGLFAYGLDLMPDFGYPPVQYGGWGSPHALWYGMTAAHNTVTVDGRNQHPPYSGILAGETKLWASGKGFQAVRASGPEIAQCWQYERTIAAIDIGGDEFYIVDIFRVVGGHDHAKFMHSHFATITTNGLNLQPAADYGHNTQMRNFQGDAAAQPGWSADWKIDDKYGLAPGRDIHLRYTDLTTDAGAYLCEGWVVRGGFDVGGQDEWIPRVMVRRTNDAGSEPLASNFVGVIEPYEGKSNIAAIRRLPLFDEHGAQCHDGYVALEIELCDGRRDLVVAADVENPMPGGAVLVQPDWQFRSDAELCHVRRAACVKLVRLAACRGSEVHVGDRRERAHAETGFIEWTCDDDDEAAAGNQNFISSEPG